MSPRAGAYSARPDEIDVLLLKAALSEGAEARESWHEACRRVGSFRGLEGETYRLLPLLYRNLSRQGVNGPALAQLKGVYRHSWYANHMHFRRAGELLGSLERESVDTLVLKGGAIARLYYDAPGTRPMEDVDVLVRAHQARRAIEVLERSGWELNTRMPIESALRTRHSAECVHPGGQKLDLHWSMLWEPTDEQPFWDRAIPLEIGGARTRALCPADQLLHICVHGVGWSMRSPYWAADAVMLMRSERGELDWRRMIDQARANELSLALERGLRFLRDEFGVLVPVAVLEALRSTPRSHSERLEHWISLAPRYRGTYTIRSALRYRRQAAHEGKRATLAGFATYQRQFWGLANRRQLLGSLLARVGQVLRNGITAPEGPDADPPRPGRS